MPARINNEFSLNALQKDANREPDASLDAALRYLTSPTVNLNRIKIEELAKDLESHENLSPEVKYYAGWAFLDAAYPGLFSLDDSPIDVDNAESFKLAETGFNFFKQLDSRAKYFNKDTPLEELANKEILLNDVLFGIKARLVRNFEDLFQTSPGGSSPQSIHNSRKKVASSIAEKLTITGLQIREQIQTTEKLMNMKHNLHTDKSINSFYANLRGIEGECAFLGAVWTAIAGGDTKTSFHNIALPASVRTDYGLTRDEPKGDVIFYHEDSKYAIEIARGKVFNAKVGRNYSSNGNTIYLYGDRDLRLPPYHKVGDKHVISPNFKGYKDESGRVMHQVLSTIKRLEESK